MLSEQLEKYIGRISNEERECLLRYDMVTLTEAVNAIRRLESFRRSKVSGGSE